MPVSPFKWSGFGNNQVFGLTYGTKRKVDEEDFNDFGLNTLFKDQSSQISAKRLCAWNEPQDNNTMNTSDNPTNQMTTDTDGMDTCTTYKESETQSMVQQEQTTLPMESNTMLMNINGDDGDESTMDDYTSAYDAMDNEGAVDTSQYRCNTNQHEQHCFGSEKSPNSGVTRCYCRPNWDTLCANRTFFSDIY